MAGQKRGFAAMDREKQRKIAQKGGRARGRRSNNQQDEELMVEEW